LLVHEIFELALYHDKKKKKRLIGNSKVSRSVSTSAESARPWLILILDDRISRLSALYMTHQLVFESFDS